MDFPADNLRALLPLIALLPVATAQAYEEPSFTVIDTTGFYELRRYEPYIVAQTVVTGDFDDVGSEAFRRLAGYIFGRNSRREDMQMTVPVESRAENGGIEMNMTAPVGSTQTSPGRYVYTFFMESRYTLETLPEPDDPRVELREVPARTMAVRRYSGSWSKRNYEKHEALLLAALADDHVPVTGEPLLARYNGPLTPWFLRRNEVMVEVAPRAR